MHFHIISTFSSVFFRFIPSDARPTFGSTGQPMLFDIPGGGSARVCTKRDTYPNGKEFVGIAIQPVIEIKKSIQDYLENSDPVLQMAIEYLKKN